jgi:hypothetical protein
MRTKPWATGARPRTIGALLSLVLLPAVPAIAIAQTPDPAPPPIIPQPDAPPGSGSPPAFQSPTPAPSSPAPSPPTPAPATTRPSAPRGAGNASGRAQREARLRAAAQRLAAARRLAAAKRRAAAKRLALQQRQVAAAVATAKRSSRSAVEGGRQAPPAHPRLTSAPAEPVHRDALVVGGALALLAVAASSTLLLAQAARLQRELGAR